jgi:hypothetical protein
VRPSGYKGPEAVLGAAGKEEQLALSTVETVRARTVFVACAGAVVVATLTYYTPYVRSFGLFAVSD